MLLAVALLGKESSDRQMAGLAERQNNEAEFNG
jgi:hypothetical protein